jgi:hypothetical protein
MTPTPRLVRLVVALQRHPMTAAVVTYAAVTASGGILRLHPSDRVAWAWATLAVAASTAFAEIGTRVTSAWGRLAVVGIGVGTTLPFSWIVFPASAEWPWFLGVSAALVAVPHGTVVCASRIPALSSRAVLPLAWAAATAGLAYMTGQSSRVPGALLYFAGWSVAVQLVVHGAAAVPSRLSVCLPIAAVAGAATGLVAGSYKPACAVEYVITQAIAWTLGALVVHVAAVGRSMTAVPDDHPINADFGGAQA